MISPIPDLPAHVVGFELSGHVSAAEYREQLEPRFEAAAAGGRKARALVVLGPGFQGFEGGAMLEDAKLGLRTWSAWERIAVVSDDKEVHSVVRLFGWMVPGDIAIFGLDELARARDWVSASDGAQG